MLNIYRYNLSEDLSKKILAFSKLYEFEERNDYKEKWELWCEENNDLILLESERLTQLGYEGKILDKMFRASRYYFRKKKLEKNIPKKRERYISLSKQLLQNIDTYINENIKLVIKPKDMFIQFCEIYDELIKETIKELNEKGFTDREEIDCKIKKTFKNRYFNLTHKSTK
jgi:hypothetical protein